MNTTPETKPANPGSYNEFCGTKDFRDRNEAMGAYTLELAAYRQALADYYGVSLDDLHAGNFKKFVY